MRYATSEDFKPHMSEPFIPGVESILTTFPMKPIPSQARIAAASHSPSERSHDFDRQTSGAVASNPARQASRLPTGTGRWEDYRHESL